MYIQLQIGRRHFPTAATTLGHLNSMISWILAFLLLALFAGALGFTGIAGASIGIAKVLFFIFIVLFVVSLIVHLAGGSGPKTDL
jgi:uncharacterized membrane protein YtjA (UPF0391 family)